MRRVLALVLVLTPLLGASAHANDPAYVDAPENRAIPDPARTDGVLADGPGAAAQASHNEQAEEERAVAQAQQDAMAQMEQITKMQVAAFGGQQQQDAANSRYMDPPIGGNSMMRQLDPVRYADPVSMPMRAPQPDAIAPRSNAAGQIGNAMLQDAAGLIDTRIQREIQPNGGVYLPRAGNNDPLPGY